MEPLAWQDCFRAMNSLAGRGRLSWPQPDSGGFNCHPGFTVTDVSGGAAWLITAPGDWILGLPAVSRFFELSTPVVGHPLSWVVGLMLCIPVFSILVVLTIAPFVYAAESRESRQRQATTPARGSSKNATRHNNPPLRPSEPPLRAKQK
jgi:hypothetical protein